MENKFIIKSNLEPNKIVFSQSPNIEIVKIDKDLNVFHRGKLVTSNEDLGIAFKDAIVNCISKINMP